MQVVQRQFQHDPQLLDIMATTSIFTNDSDKHVGDAAAREV